MYAAHSQEILEWHLRVIRLSFGCIQSQCLASFNIRPCQPMSSYHGNLANRLGQTVQLYCITLLQTHFSVCVGVLFARQAFRTLTRFAYLHLSSFSQFNFLYQQFLSNLLRRARSKFVATLCQCARFRLMHL